ASADGGGGLLEPPRPRGERGGHRRLDGRPGGAAVVGRAGAVAAPGSSRPALRHQACETTPARTTAVPSAADEAHGSSDFISHPFSPHPPPLLVRAPPAS